MRNFSHSLALIRDGFGMSAVQINAGFCADFATVVWEQWRGKVRVVSDSDLDSSREYTHTFLKYGLCFYDAEVVYGVDDWRMLPIFARQERERLAVESVPRLP